MKKNIYTLILLGTASLAAHAGTMGPIQPDYPWFASIGTGYSWSEKAGIRNPDPSTWDSSIQGYDSKLGNRGFYTFAIGKQVYSYVDVSISYLDHEIFNYTKYQTGTSPTVGFTGDNRTRYFSLDNKNVLVNGFLHPAQAWVSYTGLNFLPFIGGGIGYANNQLKNFYTNGTTFVVGPTVTQTTAIGSISTTAHSRSTDSFAWEGSAGINVQPNESHLSANFGYRYLDGGRFYGPSVVYTNASGWLSAVPWKGRVKTNQFFVEFKYTV